MIPEDLLKTNRPPTYEERAKIQEDMAPYNSKLKTLGVKIPDLKLQIKAMELELQGLCDEEAAAFKASAQHRLALSPFRTLPDDVIREIFIACIDPDLFSPMSPKTAPLLLARICSRTRWIALTTPTIWASIHISFDLPHYGNQPRSHIRKRRDGAREWIGRAGELPLAISVQATNGFGIADEYPPADELFDTLLSCSTRWRDVNFDLKCLVAPLVRIATLTANDVPLLRSATLKINRGSTMFDRGTLLMVPTLTHLSLCTQGWSVAAFSVNWANLTFLQIEGKPWVPESAISDIAHILHQTTHLAICSLDVGTVTERGYIGEIFLPLLKVLLINEVLPLPADEVCGLLGFINAPVLEELGLASAPLTNSLATLLKRSPNLQELGVVSEEPGFTGLVEPLSHCASLTSLHIRRTSDGMIRLPEDVNIVPADDTFLEAFICSDDKTRLCPRLETFRCKGKLDVSVDTLRRFFARTQADGMGLQPWKEVMVEVRSQLGP